jgi:hypothetical protein
MIKGIEPRIGQIWKTRDGKIVRIVGMDNDPEYPITCEICSNTEIGFCVTREGRYWDGGLPEPKDLIELVQDVVTPKINNNLLNTIKEIRERLDTIEQTLRGKE